MLSGTGTAFFVVWGRYKYCIVQCLTLGWTDFYIFAKYLKFNIWCFGKVKKEDFKTF